MADAAIITSNVVPGTTVTSGVTSGSTVSSTVSTSSANTANVVAGGVGATGATGATGAAGTNGQGVPTGGSTNQVLAKASATNYDTAWVDAASGSGQTPFLATVGTADADYITDGTADNVQIQQAVDAVIAASGGTVFIKAGTYNLAAAIAINGNNVTIIGTGEGTVLKTANGSDVNGINISGTGTINAKVKMLKIDCNKANNTYGAGIQFNTPWSATDPNHVLEDLYIVNCSNNGIEFTSSSDTRVPLFRNIHIQDCEGNGIYMPNPSSTDGIFENIIVDRVALNGLFIGGANHHFLNCKTFYCGSTAGSNHGFYINGYNNYFENCEAQDNYQSGFYLDATGDATYTARGCTFVNCIADSNGQAANAAYSSGWQIVNVPDTQIIGGIAMTRPYPSFTQIHGVRMTGTTTRTKVIGMWFSSNTNAWTDASSGTNYRMWCTGQTTEASTVPGAINLGTNQLNLGTGAAYLSGTGTRALLDGGATSIQIQNFNEIFLKDATAGAATIQFDMFDANNRTLAIKNESTGFGMLSVDEGAIINANGSDSDTQIKGDTDANLIYVDASTDRVGIGGATPAVKLDVTGEIRASTAGTNSASVVTVGGTQTLTNKTTTGLKMDGALDTGGVKIIEYTPNASAVNYLVQRAGSTGQAVLLSAESVTDTDVYLNLQSQGAGTVRANGVDVTTISGTQTLTNKRITKRTGTATSSATPTINTDNVDFYSLTAQTVDITSFSTNLSGTPTTGQTLWIAITGTASRALTFGSSFEASTVALPTTTSGTSRLDMGFVWNSVTSKWRIVAAA